MHPCVNQNRYRGKCIAKGTPNPLPDMLENVPVKIMVTGEIKAFKGKPGGGGGGGVSHTAKQTAPNSLGTSGGWIMIWQTDTAAEVPWDHS